MLTTEERTRLFGPPGAAGAGNRRTVGTPWSIRVVVHHLIVPVFVEACRAAAFQSPFWVPQRIDSYADRAIRGSNAPSLHSWALAFDFFTTPPGVVPPGGVWQPDDEMPPAFWNAFTDRGFRWGGTFRSRRDTPHIEWDGRPPQAREEDDVPPANALMAQLDLYDREDVVGSIVLQFDGDIVAEGGARNYGDLGAVWNSLAVKPRRAFRILLPCEEMGPGYQLRNEDGWWLKAGPNGIRHA